MGQYASLLAPYHLHYSFSQLLRCFLFPLSFSFFFPPCLFCLPFPLSTTFTYIGRSFFFLLLFTGAMIIDTHMHRNKRRDLLWGLTASSTVRGLPRLRGVPVSLARGDYRWVYGGRSSLASFSRLLLVLYPFKPNSSSTALHHLIVSPQIGAEREARHSYSFFFFCDTISIHYKRQTKIGGREPVGGVFRGNQGLRVWYWPLFCFS